MENYKKKLFSSNNVAIFAARKLEKKYYVSTC